VSQPRLPAPRTVILRPIKGWAPLNWRDLMDFRELTYFLTWRNIKVRYKQTLLGASWAILEPFLTMVVFSIFFGNLAQVGSYGVPYPLFSFAGLLPWGLFSKALNDAIRSLVNNRHMITKIYFPRLILPLSSILSGLVDFAIALVVLFGIMLYYKTWPTAAAWWLPLLLLLALVTAVFAAGLPRVELRTIFSDLFPSNHPFVQTFRDHPNFGNPLTVTIMVKRKDGDIYNAETLQKIWNMTRDIDITPAVDHDQVLSISTEKARFQEATPFGIDSQPLMGDHAPATA